MPLRDRSVRPFVWKVLLAMGIYLLGALGFSLWAYKQQERQLMEQVDQRLMVGASALQGMLAPDFHDRATGPDSISLEEEMEARRRFNEFAASGGFKYVYTVIERGGGYYFAAPTVTEEEARERERWYFYPYEDIPKEFVRALKDRRPAFVSYTDEWGTFRSVALPQRSQGGTWYLACADYDISYIRGLLVREAVRSFLEEIFFLLLLVPALWVIRELLLEIKRDLARAEESEERLRLAVESTGLALWDVNFVTGNWTVNGQYREIFGYGLEGGEDWLDTVHPEDRERVQRAWEDHLAGLTDRYEAEFRKRSAFGDYLWVSDHGRVYSRDSRGGPLRAVGTLKDVTSRKMVEEMLRSAKEQAQAESQARSRLMSRVSHEIRTPLNSIMGYLDLLKERGPSLNLPQDASEWLDTIQRSGYHLLSVVEEIMDMSTIEAGKLKVREDRFNLRDLVSEVEHLMSLGAQRKGLDLRVRYLKSVPDQVTTDRGKVKQVLINLLGNAIKFTDEGTVTMEIWVESVRDMGARSHATVCFRVRDSGPGVDPSIRRSLFQPFEKHGSRGGAGLGLAISHSFAEALGGSLELEEVESGASFVLKVPVTVEEPLSVTSDLVVEEPSLTEEEKRSLVDAISSGDRETIHRSIQGVSHQATRDMLLELFRNYDYGAMIDLAGEGDRNG